MQVEGFGVRREMWATWVPRMETNANRISLPKRRENSHVPDLLAVPGIQRRQPGYFSAGNAPAT